MKSQCTFFGRKGMNKKTEPGADWQIELASRTEVFSSAHGYFLI